MFNLLETRVVLNSPRTGMLLERHPRARLHEPNLQACPCLPGEQSGIWKVRAHCHLSRVGRPAHVPPVGTQAWEMIICIARGLLPLDKNGDQEKPLSRNSLVIPPDTPQDLGGENPYPCLECPELVHSYAIEYHHHLYCK